jgi:phospholipase D1/2
MRLTRKSILTNQNTWRRAKCTRAAFLVDGEAYFSAFREAVQRAERSIFILGWEIDSRVRLFREGEPPEEAPRLETLLDQVVSRKKNLHAYLLIWDYAMIFALEREWFPEYALDWRTNRRIRFRSDRSHPAGASHHQKIVVIDDRVAFVGGFDITKRRWDTPDHNSEEPRRTDPEGFSYPPFHDIQIMVEGEAAAALGELARMRWKNATGERLFRVKKGKNDIWPPGVLPDLENIEVGIARTSGEWGNKGGVREVERLYLDMIRHARKTIYIENQSFTSNKVGDALARRLGEADGPELILVLPEKSSGWLEQTTLDVLRARLLSRLRSEDRFGRLHCYYPFKKGLGEKSIMVHAKVMIVDDRLVRVGSSNLTNRSMGLDTECDIVIDAGSDASIRRRIAGFRDRLLAEHLGTEPELVAAAIEAEGALHPAIESLGGTERCLKPLDGKVSEALDAEIPDASVIDPEIPMAPERLLNYFIPDRERRSAGGRFVRVALFLLVLIGVSIAWKWTPLKDWADPGQVLSRLHQIRNVPFAPFIAVAGFVTGGLVGFPVTLLVVAAAVVFGPLVGFICSIAGVLLSAAVTYAVGSFLGEGLLQRFAGSRIDRINRIISRRGVIYILAVRVVPIAPFTVINLLAGASAIRFRDYMLGTVLGMAPGVLAISLFVRQARAALMDPGFFTYLMLILVVLILVGSIFFFRRWIIRKEEKFSESEDHG